MKSSLHLATTSLVLTLVLQVGEVVIYCLGFSPLHKIAWNFFNASVTFPRYILATEPQKNFYYICYCPPNFGGEHRAPQMAKNWFQAYIGLGMPQMEKSDGYIHVFTCSQASSSSGNFSWLHMQTGSRNPPKPEVVITLRRKPTSTWSQCSVDERGSG